MHAAVSINAKELMQMSSKLIADADYDKMYEIAGAVLKDRSLIKDFEQDPLTAAKKINGFAPPPGFHMHIVDEKNEYHPKEADALSQIASQTGEEAWSRIEVRAGVDQIACIICLWCRSAVMM